MSVAPGISLATVEKELEQCNAYREKYGWEFSDIDSTNQTFTVKMHSSVDEELYILEVQFNNYPEIPLLLEFHDPETGEKGIKRAYPRGNDSFFHSYPCICNPCSRKSYKEFDSNAPHGDWNLQGWRNNPKVGSLISIPSILLAIQTRINNKNKYNGRMG